MAQAIVLFPQMLYIKVLWCKPFVEGPRRRFLLKGVFHEWEKAAADEVLKPDRVPIPDVDAPPTTGILVNVHQRSVEPDVLVDATVVHCIHEVDLGGPLDEVVHRPIDFESHTPEVDAIAPAVGDGRIVLHVLRHAEPRGIKLRAATDVNLEIACLIAVRESVFPAPLHRQRVVRRTGLCALGLLAALSVASSSSMYS